MKNRSISDNGRKCIRLIKNTVLFLVLFQSYSPLNASVPINYLLLEENNLWNEYFSPTKIDFSYSVHPIDGMLCRDVRSEVKINIEKRKELVSECGVG